jgi:hypothetical protein
VRYDIIAGQTCRWFASSRLHPKSKESVGVRSLPSRKSVWLAHDGSARAEGGYEVDMQEHNGGEFTSLRPIDGSFLLNCTRCQRFHAADEALELNGVCAACAGGYPMGSIEMRGFYALTRDAIDARVNETPPGDYALGYLDGGAFQLFSVGRSDADVEPPLARLGRSAESIQSIRAFHRYYQ